MGKNDLMVEQNGYNCENNGQIVKWAIRVCQALDKVADKTLPVQIAGVVKLHCKLAVGAAWVPVPGADLAAAATNIWSMYYRINSKLASVSVKIY